MISRDKGGRLRVYSRARFKNGSDRLETIKKIKFRRVENGLLNPNYSNWGNIDKYKMSIQKKTKRLISTGEVKVPDYCETCGSKENLHVHHIKYTCDPKDWKILCCSCHCKLHWKNRKAY